MANHRTPAMDQAHGALHLDPHDHDLVGCTQDNVMPVDCVGHNETHREPYPSSCMAFLVVMPTYL